jgi:hypothetical protein
MASRNRSRAREELHVEELDDVAIQPHETRPKGRSRPSAQPVAGQLEAKAFQIAGAIGLVAGLGLWVGSGFHAGLAGVADTLGKGGLHPAALTLGALVLLAFARVRSGQVQLARGEDKQEDDHLLEQVATEQVHGRQSLDRLARGQVELTSGLQEINSQVQALIQGQTEARERSEASSPDQEAIFRLAASLDQLGARVEQRMQSQYEAFHSGLQKVGREIVQAQKDLRSLLSKLPRPDAGASAVIEPLMAEVELDAPAVDEAPTKVWDPESEAAQQMPIDLESTGYSLGVLDSIPDEVSGTEAPALSETGQRTLIRREGAAPRAPLPAESAHTPLAGIVPEEHRSPAERAAELDTSTKLTQLKDLLADDRLRAALEEMRRNG